ncbi:MAG: hypothetical protein GWN58_43050, partial [Anaerolineae bacterium]|nr:hypothetical protein [Anaerolineae bacterium]
EALGKIVDPVTGWIDAIDVATERARMFKREQLQGISEVVDAQEEETEGVIDGEKEKQKAIKDTAKARKDAADEALQALEDERQFLRDMAQLEK